MQTAISNQDIVSARTSVMSWYHERKLSSVPGNISEMKRDAYIVKKHLLVRLSDDNIKRKKWNDMCSIFQYRFGTNLGNYED